MAQANFYQVLSFHVILGLASTITPFALIGWFYLVLFQFILQDRKTQAITMPYLLLYILPIELLGRMSEAYPYIPTEMGKYLSILLLLYATSALGGPIKKTNWAAWAMLLLSLPSLLLVPFTYYSWRFEVTYNYLVILTLCMYTIYFARQRFYKEEIFGMIKIAVAGIGAILVYSIIKAPQIDPSAFELASSTEFTGGFGANQVSTVLGFGIGIVIFSWLFEIKFTSAIVMMSFLALALLWSLFSFSRGGVISSILALVGALVISANGRQKIFKKGRFLFIGLGATAVFFIANDLTGGQLLLRYQGETAGTLAGHKEKNLDYITSNRSVIVANDFEMWMDHPLFGVGPGQSKLRREDYGLEPVAPHVELTRLLAEHGLFGLIIGLIWLGIPLFRVSNEKDSIARSFITFLFIVAFLSTMHSAMRTTLSPLAFGLACARYRFVGRAVLLRYYEKKRAAKLKVQLVES